MKPNLKILLVQTSFLGDTILSTPVITGLKKIHPRARIWMMTTPAAAELVQRDPLLDGVIPFDKRNNDAGFPGIYRTARRLRAMRFDRAYSLHRSRRTAMTLWLSRIPVRIGFKTAAFASLYNHQRPRPHAPHDVIRNLALLQNELPLQHTDTRLRLFAPHRSELTQKATDLLAPVYNNYAVLVPGSAWPTKRWHHQGFRQVAAHLKARGLGVIVIGAPAEADVARQVATGLDIVNLAGRTTVSDLLYIIKHARLIVCNDSMSLHVASAFKVPTAAVFCATSPRFGFYPWKNRAIIVERSDLSCKPCRPHGGNTCPTQTNACMQGLAPARVIHAVDRLLAT